MTKIFVLEEEYEIGERVRLKSDKIEKILNWLRLDNNKGISRHYSIYTTLSPWFY